MNSLSGGQRQRVALARALVTEPKILLLDEPLSALDAHLVIRMQGVLTKLQRELGITFVYVTHSQSEAFAMADRVVIMSKGEIAQIGSARDIYRTPANRFVAEFVGRNNIFSGTANAAGAVETPAGTFELDEKASPGAQVSFVVAADVVSLSTTKPAAQQRLHRAADLGGIRGLHGDAVLRGGGRHGGEGAGAGASARRHLRASRASSFILSFDPSHAHVLKG